MTRRRDLMLEDLLGCTHEPETPVTDTEGSGEILYWICRCGKRLTYSCPFDCEGRSFSGGPCSIEEHRTKEE